MNDIELPQGSTYRAIARWGVPACTLKAITAISLTAPATLTVPSHGLVNGWPVTIEGADSMEAYVRDDLGGATLEPITKHQHSASPVDDDTITLPCVNTLASKAYAGKAALRYNAPVDMAGYAGRLQVRNKAGDLLISLTSDDGDIIINNTTKTIEVVFMASRTVGATWKSASFALEMYVVIDSKEYVTTVASGEVILIRETVRP
jgi:hypothetical protein